MTSSYKENAIQSINDSIIVKQTILDQDLITPILKIANLIRDIKTLDVARKEAFALVDRDPNLKEVENQPLKNAVHRLLGKHLPLMEII